MTEAAAWQKTLHGRDLGWLGREFHFFEEIGSTNVFVRERAGELAHGAVVLADHQTAGRGRLNRAWLAPAGSSLLVSIFVRPDWPAERAGWLTMIAGLAAQKGIAAATGLDVQLKWPNDVVRQRPDGTLAKLGGILSEGHFEGERLAWGTAGIGLNVNIGRDDLPEAAQPPTSLLLETGRPQSREILLGELLAAFKDWYERCAAGDSPQPEWGAQLLTIGRPVTVREQRGEGTAWSGFAEGVDDQGRLLVRDEGGLLHPLSAGDVTLRAA